MNPSAIINKIANKIDKRFLKISSLPNLIEKTRLELLFNSHKNFPTNTIIQNELDQLDKNFFEILSTKNIFLNKIVKYVISNQGKRMRPSLAILMARAINPSYKKYDNEHFYQNQNICYKTDFDRQLRIAEVVELIHTGSLLHDDILDKAETRRGKESVAKRYGNKAAVLSGDFLISRASVSIGLIADHEVTRLMSESISDLVTGEMTFVEYTGRETTDDLLQIYNWKNFLKTASLIANTCKCVAILSKSRNEIVKAAFEFGKNLGLAFQIIDDILDVSQLGESAIGKPQNNDIKLGLITAPLIFASEKSAELRQILQRKFKEKGDAEKAKEILVKSDGIKLAAKMAEDFSLKALEYLYELPNSPYRDNLAAWLKFLVKRRV